MAQAGSSVVNFYKAYNNSLIVNSIFLISKKILQSNEKLAILCSNLEEEEYLDSKLWTASQSEFLPHMCFSAPEFEEFKKDIPVVITSDIKQVLDFKNIIILKSLEEVDILKNFTKVFFVFSNEKEEDVLNARVFWKKVSTLNDVFELKFYLQQSNMKWELNLTV